MAKAGVVRTTIVKKKAERPSRYKVILLNDPFAPTAVVLRLLLAVFRKTAHEALEVLAAARRTGAAVVAVYTQEVAETKAQIASDFAAKLRQPVSFRIEPAD